MNMRSTLVAALLFSAFVPPTFAQDKKEPGKELGKTAAEWQEILLTSKNPKAKRLSLLVLERFGPNTKGVMPTLMEALEKEPSAEIRREVALLLGRTGPVGNEAKGAAVVLADALRRDKSDEVREAIALAFGDKFLDDAEEYLPALASALKDPHAGTRVALVKVMRQLGARAKPALPSLLDLARDSKGDRFSRALALGCLVKLEPENVEIANVLQGVLGDKQAPPKLRETTAEELAKVQSGIAATVQVLGVTLKEPSADLRLAAAGALVKHGEKAYGAWATIAEGLKDGDPRVRHQLIRCAGTIAKKHLEARTDLLESAKIDSSAENRLAAIQEIGELGDVSEAILKEVEALAQNDGRQSIRDAAAVALKKLMK